MYALSRRDIPIAQQAVQAAHAAMEHAYQNGRPADHHPSYVHVTVKDKQQLLHYLSILQQEDISSSEFHEPYEDWGLTAISCCITQDHRHLFKGLPLWKVPTQKDIKEGEHA